MTADMQRELAAALMADPAINFDVQGGRFDVAAVVGILLPTVQRLIERERQEAAAAALEAAAREDSVSTHRYTPVEALTLRVVKVEDLLIRAGVINPAGADSRETGR